jgi:hypothetical protein
MIYQIMIVCVCFSILKIKNVDMSILQVKNLAIY